MCGVFDVWISFNILSICLYDVYSIFGRQAICAMLCDVSVMCFVGVCAICWCMSGVVC